jgi:hypothetical protein
VEFLQNIQSCGRNSLGCKIEADELQECTLPWRRADKGAGMDGESDNESSVEEEEDFETVCYEDILSSFEEPLEISTHDDDPEFQKEDLNGFSFDSNRNKGRKGCGYKKDVEVPVRRSGPVLNGIPFVLETNIPSMSTQPVKPDYQKRSKSTQ